MKRIVIKRWAALGDVLCATPIIARLRQLEPDAHITVHTAYPAVFEGNPAIDALNIEADFDQEIDLNMSHETQRGLMAIDAYMMTAFGDTGDGYDKSIEFTPSVRPSLGIDWRKTIVVHPNKSWPNRTMPNAWWDKVTNKLHKAGLNVVALGTNIDHIPTHAIDTRDKLNLHQQAAVIAASKVFICGASGLFILAACTETPVVVPMTINRPETALPWRQGVKGWRYFTLNAQVPCLGCSEHLGPVTEVGCSSPDKLNSFPDYACIQTIDPREAVNLALTLAKL